VVNQDQTKMVALFFLVKLVMNFVDLLMLLVIKVTGGWLLLTVM
jgi:hypothetical protein